MIAIKVGKIKFRYPLLVSHCKFWIWDFGLAVSLRSIH